MSYEPQKGDIVIEKHQIAQERRIEFIWPEQGYASCRGIASGRVTRIQLDRLRTRYQLVHRPGSA